MIKRVLGPQNQKRYTPTPMLEKYISEKLQYLKKKESSRALDTRKVHVLDKIFQSMADLIYFLEKIAVNPDLQKVFEEDLWDLFDLRSENYNIAKQLHPLFGTNIKGIRIQETALTRLIFAILMPHKSDHDFRLRLTYILQCVIYAKMWLVLRNEFGYDSQITKSALEDLENSLGWTGLLGKSKDEYQKSELGRIIDFSAPYGEK